MLQFNPDNYKYHHGLRRALNLTPDASGQLSEEQREQLSQLYDGLQAQYPRSSAARRIPLDFKVCPYLPPLPRKEKKSHNGTLCSQRQPKGPPLATIHMAAT